MRILLAGATGAIGRPLIRCLKENGHTVFGLARSAQSATPSQPEIRSSDSSSSGEGWAIQRSFNVDRFMSFDRLL